MNKMLSMTELAMWLALLAGKALLCLCIPKKQMVRRLPWFSAYVFASTAKSVVLLALSFWGGYAAYYYTFHLSEFFEAVLAFLTLIQCGRQVLPGLELPDKKKAVGWLLAALGGAVIFCALWPVRFIENRIEICAFLGIAVTLIFIAVYARYLRLHWSRLLAGVCATLGFLYLVGGIVRIISFHYPFALASQISRASQIANILAVLAWTIVILSPWGEVKVTQADLTRARQILSDAEDNLRHVASGGAK